MRDLIYGRKLDIYISLSLSLRSIGWKNIKTELKSKDLNLE